MAEPSTEQLNDAFRAVFARPGRDAEPAEPTATPVTPAVTQAETPAEPVQAVAETPATEPATNDPGQTTTEVGQDDLASLKQRLDTLQAQREVESKRTSAGLEWARNLALRKSSELDRYRQVVERLKKGDQIDVAEIDKLIATPSEALPQAWQPSSAPANSLLPAVQAQPAGQNELGPLDTAQFLADYGLDEARAESFRQFLTDPSSPIGPRDIVAGNEYATLALTYAKFQQAEANRRTASAATVRSLADTQRRATKAASAVVAQTSASPPAEPPKDWTKMTPKEREDSGLIDNAFKQFMGFYN